jgi:predicted membrane channel-forming protein YqfA (hemolysin III family)
MHKGNSKLMWLMMAGCLLLPVAILFFSGRGFSSSNWLLLGVIVLCVGGHALMMRGHDHGEEKDEQKHHH